jgi:hypothetical protein
MIRPAIQLAVGLLVGFLAGLWWNRDREDPTEISRGTLTRIHRESEGAR